jgi:ankyrin repeat protein
MMELLIDNGLDLNHDGAYGGELSPLTIALEEENMEMVKLLISRGARISGFDDPPDQLPIQTVIMECPLNTISAFVDLGADVNEIDSRGTDALLTAMSILSPDIVSFLLDRGARVKTTHLECCERNISQCLSPEVLNMGGINDARRSFCISCMLGEEGSIRLFINGGFGLNFNLSEPFATCLEAAVHHKQASVVKTLLEAGADASAVSADILEGLLKDSDP